jgi:hypothetical protein
MGAPIAPAHGARWRRYTFDSAKAPAQKLYLEAGRFKRLWSRFKEVFLVLFLQKKNAFLRLL